ncbi:bifunctional riboflavin kinase/FAD synthetase [Desulfohalovibrio reitneri]|uniref:bifunctional riboflavin kinase/FAD synthetase n=1 Tax=Desulfohalovibrio reitneri TaxID=1307759 RepID=UPI0004A6F748|nr:bifunctional riboflavin kinase/FAD synthetase [Desulfohalovibrio reitneri]
MIVINDPSELEGSLTESCVTLGNFDGVHKGHQKLISSVTQHAVCHHQLSVVVTFEPHPMKVLAGRKAPPFITLLDQKLELIAALGVEVCLVMPFTRELAALPPEEFVRSHLVEGLRMKALYIGYDYAFGRNRAGDYSALKALGERYGYSVTQLGPVMVGDAVVSSTRIRDLVQAGRLWDARELLGRFYQVAGKVVSGVGRGAAQLGFPTANLELVDELVPRVGVYACWAELLDKPREEREPVPAVVNVGHNPTFGEGADLSVEAHLLDFAENIYGQNIRLHFVQRIRDEQRFSGPEELVARITEDVRLGRRILAASEALL